MCPRGLADTEVPLTHEGLKYVAKLVTPQHWRCPDGVPFEDALRQGLLRSAEYEMDDRIHIRDYQAWYGSNMVP